MSALAGTPLLVAICLGSAVFVLLALVSVCFVLRRRSQRHYSQGPLKQFLLPKNVKPVISFKTAAGPGGLKKSPSPIQSPEGMDNEWASRSSHPGTLELSLTDSHTSQSSSHDSMTGSVTEQNLLRVENFSPSPSYFLNAELRWLFFAENLLCLTFGTRPTEPPAVLANCVLDGT